MSIEISLPNLGEGIESGIVASIIAKEGDILQKDDTLLELETDKAVLPVPASIENGIRIDKINVQEGDEIKPGHILAIGVSHLHENDTKNKEIEIKKNSNNKLMNESEVNFSLPDLGEGIESGIVASVIVKEGDEVTKEDTILELETDKAILPVPANYNGIITSIKFQEGDEIKVGDIVFTIKQINNTSAKKTPVVSEIKGSSLENKEQFNDVETNNINSKFNSPTSGEIVLSSTIISAGPGTRKLARELGVDLGQVNGTGKRNRITLDDVKLFTKSIISGGKNSSITSANLDLPDFSRFGEIKREKITHLRKVISSNISKYWTQIPHVHQFHEFDVTEITEIQKKHASIFKEEGSALSVTQFLIKSIVLCLKEFPLFNTSFDTQKEEIIYKNYYHVGVAVDTPSGLIVPVLRDVNKKSIFQIGKELKDIAKRARERKVKPNELQGGCITLSNLGGIGGQHFTPIINHPEVAIIGASRSETKPIWNGSAFVPRTILPICVAYDHRVIDGADGARFTMKLKNYMENVSYSLMK